MGRPLPRLRRGAAPVVVGAALAAPLLAGLLGTALPAFGYLPAIGGHRLSGAPFRALLAAPGLGHAILLSLGTGLVATLLSLALVQGFCAATFGTRWLRLASRMLAPLLATPHAALAIGLAFLIAPSGWLLRLLSPWATGFARPPDWSTVNDPWGVALTAGLVLKEAPYLLFMTLAALNQVPTRPILAVAQSLGHRPASAWFTAVLPLIYPQIRAPVLAVLAFSLSVVDVALILGPSGPPTLAVLVLRDLLDPDLARWFVGSAGAMLLLGLVLAAMAAWRAGEIAVAALGRALLRRGGRSLDLVATALACGLAGALGSGAVALALLGAWSIAGLWRFPDAWPQSWTLATWRGHAPELGAALGTTCAIALLATAIALAGAVAWLEAEDRRGGRLPLRLAYLPLLVPQTAFLFGLQVVFVRLRVDGTLAAVVLAHLMFVVPYVLLSLADPWRALDLRLARTAAALGAAPWRVLWTVKLPLMLRPALAAAAVGVAVSVGLYLPTLFAGAGRVVTLTTEAVTLAGSADRRVLGVYGALQAAVPWAAYAAAVAVPRWVHRGRRSLEVT